MTIQDSYQDMLKLKKNFKWPLSLLQHDNEKHKFTDLVFTHAEHY